MAETTKNRERDRERERRGKKEKMNRGESTNTFLNPPKIPLHPPSFPAISSPHRPICQCSSLQYHLLRESSRKEKSRSWNCRPRFLLFSALPMGYLHSNASNRIRFLETSTGWGWVEAASFGRALLWRWFSMGTRGEAAIEVMVTRFTKGSILVWWFLRPKARNQLQSSNSWAGPSLERFQKLLTGEFGNPFSLMLKYHCHVWCSWLKFDWKKIVSSLPRWSDFTNKSWVFVVLIRVVV